MLSFDDWKSSLDKSGVCPLCNQYFVGLKIHFKSCYSKLVSTDNSNINVAYLDSLNSINKNRGSGRSNKLIDSNKHHEQVNDSSKKLKCLICLKLFVNLNTLNYHQLKYHSDTSQLSTNELLNDFNLSICLFESINYDLIRRDRLVNKGGVILVFIKKEFK